MFEEISASSDFTKKTPILKRKQSRKKNLTKYRSAWYQAKFMQKIIKAGQGVNQQITQNRQIP